MLYMKNKYDVTKSNFVSIESFLVTIQFMHNNHIIKCVLNNWKTSVT